MNYRKKIDVNVIRFPKGFEEEDRGLKGCCKPCKVLASSTDLDNEKNDITGVYIKSSDVSDIVTFSITKCGTSGALSQLGDVGIFPNDDLLVGFIYNWREYLTTYGIGTYTIRVDFTISGVTGGYVMGMYDLNEFSIDSARGTVRVWSEFNSYFQKDLADFTNSNFKDSVRFNGFFGNREPKTEVNNLITKGRKVEKITRENLNMWTLRTDPVTICVTRRLLNFHFLCEDTILISDHNASNHDYLLFDVPVVIEDTPEIEYIDRSRLAKITATFGDRAKLSKSFYNVQ